MDPLLLVAIAAIGAVALLVYFLVRNAIVRRRTVCPRRGVSCEIEVLQRGFCGEGKPLRVESCTLFANPRRIECEEECLRISSTEEERP